MRAATKDDIPVIAEQLRRAPHENLFARGTLAAFLRGDPSVRVWYRPQELAGEGEDRSAAVVTQVHANGAISAPIDGNEEAYASMIERKWEERLSDGIVQVSGMTHVLAAVLPYLKEARAGFQRVLSYARLVGAPRSIGPSNLVERVRQVEPDELDELERCYAGGEWGGQTASRRDAVLYGRAYVLEVGGQVGSAAYVHPLLDDAGIIRAVYTPVALRRHGYATALVEGISRMLAEEDVTPCLMYDDPAAGRIYQRIGYRDFGHWRTVQLISRRGLG